jgi:hypothetical protein
VGAFGPLLEFRREVMGRKADKNPEEYFNSPQGHIRDKIIIHEGLDIPKEGMFISLNGFPFLAKPGVEIDIPRPVRKMLDTRIITVTSHDDNGKEYTKDIRRVNYTIVKEGVNLPDPEPEAAEA